MTVAPTAAPTTARTGGGPGRGPTPGGAGGASARSVEERVARLSAAAARRLVEPDEAVPGEVGPGQLLPDDLLSTAGLPVALTAGQRATLAREEVASIAAAGIRFEAVLEAGFAAQVARARDLTDPRLEFILHEMGEETRHQRLFQRLLRGVGPTAGHAVPFRLVAFGYGRAVALACRHRALFTTLVLGGEEIPDLFQKVAGEHPDTDPFVREVNRYHRAEEARHLAFARAVLPEVWAGAGPIDRYLVRRVAPLLVGFMFDTMVQPGVYATVGLPPLRTWRAVARSPRRVQMRWEATRPVLRALRDAGALRRRVPRRWRRLCGVDAAGRDRPDRFPPRGEPGS